MQTIVITANTGWNLYNFRYNLIKTLIKHYKVVIIAPFDEYIEKLKQLGCECYNIYIDKKGVNPFHDIKTIFQYYKLYKKIKPDLSIHFTIKPNIYGSLVCGLLNIPAINNVTGLGSAFIADNFVTKIVIFLYKITLRNTFVFFHNCVDRRLFLRLKLVTKQASQSIPGSGVDLEFFKPVSYEKKDNIFRFLLIARLIWDKGIGEYVKAAEVIKQKYPNTEFLLIGEMNSENPKAIPSSKIYEWQEKNIIKYLGTFKDVRPEIAKADCIVMPSYREGISKVTLEALAMAKPVIVTNVPGCKELVKHNINGYICESKNYKDLADKMESMLNLSEEKRKEMGKNSREIAKLFDEKTVIYKYLKIIECILFHKMSDLHKNKIMSKCKEKMV